MEHGGAKSGFVDIVIDPRGIAVVVSGSMKIFPILPVLALLFSSCATPGGASGGGEMAMLDGPLPNKFGSVGVKDSGSECSLSASAPSRSPLTRQQLQFFIASPSFGGWTTHRFLVQTGSSKSLAAVQSLLAEALKQSSTATAGTELAKIGDIKFGGELRVVAMGGGVTFAYNPALPSGNPDLTAGEAAAFAELLGR